MLAIGYISTSISTIKHYLSSLIGSLRGRTVRWLSKDDPHVDQIHTYTIPIIRTADDTHKSSPSTMDNEFTPAGKTDTQDSTLTSVLTPGSSAASAAISVRDAEEKSKGGSIGAPREHLTREQRIQKASKNTMKAIQEHLNTARSEKEKAVYVTQDEAIQSMAESSSKSSASQMVISVNAYGQQGRRPTMEDAHGHLKLSQGMALWVLDGHGGAHVANHVNEYFKQNFERVLRETHEDVPLAFERIIHEAHESVRQKYQPAYEQLLKAITELTRHKLTLSGLIPSIRTYWRLKQQFNKCKNEFEKWKSGTTVALSFIDNRGKVYSATLADTEVNLLMPQRGQMKSLPLSPIRNWTTNRDKERYDAYMKSRFGYYYQTFFREASDPKLKRLAGCINVSRGIGDCEYESFEGCPGIVHKPKITVYQLQGNPGDVLTLVQACDGLRDYVHEDQVVKVVEDSMHNGRNVARELVNHALRVGSDDNVTVQAIKITFAEPSPSIV